MKLLVWTSELGQHAEEMCSRGGGGSLNSLAQTDVSRFIIEWASKACNSPANKQLNTSTSNSTTQLKINKMQAKRGGKYTSIVPESNWEKFCEQI